MTFELEAYDPDDALPHDMRLDYAQDLVGHKISAVITECAGAKADGSEVLIVTETGCWIVLASTDDPEWPTVIVERGKSWMHNETISEYASADQMLQTGLITQAQRDYLRAEEKKREDEKKAKRAAALRAELAKLENAA